MTHDVVRNNIYWTILSEIVPYYLQGVSKKMRRSVCLISPATSSLHSWDIFQMKGDIHSFVLSTSSLLYDIGEPRYKQNKTGYQILRIRYLSIFDNLEYLQSYWWSLKTKIGQIHKEHSNNIHWRLNSYNLLSFNCTTWDFNTQTSPLLH